MKVLIALIVFISSGLLPYGQIALADGPANQQAVLVTGASTGIGLSIVETLSKNGFYVYAGARKAQDLSRLDAMENVSSVRLDITSQEDIAAAVKFVTDEGRGLWGIVNNAGVIRYSPLQSGPEADFQFTFDVNVFGPYRINQAFLPLILESHGRTTIIGSINGFIPNEADGGYAASKFAVEGYTDSLALELAKTGVDVSIVEPGAYKSSIRDKMASQAFSAAESGDIQLNDQTRKELADFASSNEAMKEPDEVAQAVLHLMSSKSPKPRYMVTPNAEQAKITIRYAMQRLLQLNEGQPYSYDRDQLVALLDELLGN